MPEIEERYFNPALLTRNLLSYKHLMSLARVVFNCLQHCRRSSNESVRQINVILNACRCTVQSEGVSQLCRINRIMQLCWAKLVYLATSSNLKIKRAKGFGLDLQLVRHSAWELPDTKKFVLCYISNINVDFSKYVWVQFRLKRHFWIINSASLRFISRLI